MSDLPYSFDLLYDLKTLDQLVDHLSGKCRAPVSSTDLEILETCRDHGINLPADLERRIQDEMMEKLIPQDATLLVVSQIEKQLIKVQEGIWEKRYQPMFETCESYLQAAQVADTIVAEVKDRQGNNQGLPKVIKTRLMQQMAQYGNRYVRSRHRKNHEDESSPNLP